MLAALVEMMAIFEKRKYTLGDKISHEQIVQFVALAISFVLHAMLYFSVGSGSGGHGVGRSPHLVRSVPIFLQLAESETRTISVFVEQIEQPASEKQTESDVQQNQSKKKVSQREEQAGKQSAIAPIIMDAKPYYFRTEQLTVKPMIVHDVDLPQDPLLAPLKTQTVILRLYVNEAGGIDDVLIQASQLPEVATDQSDRGLGDGRVVPVGSSPHFKRLVVDSRFSAREPFSASVRVCRRSHGLKPLDRKR